MKSFYHQTHYQLLEVRPAAQPEIITTAYHRALEAFSSESAAAYTLFTEKERRQLVERLKTAYATLSNLRTRREYDRKLLAEGLISTREKLFTDERADREEAEEPLAAANGSAPKARPLKSLVKTKGEPLELRDGRILTGADLARLRISRGVELTEIFQRTRVPLKALAALESDHHQDLPALVYLKGYLTSYASALDLDSQTVTQAYLAGIKD